jgi:hypothetical protein
MLKHDARTLAAVILRSLSASMVQLGAQLPTTNKRPMCDVCCSMRRPAGTSEYQPVLAVVPYVLFSHNYF